MATAWTTLKIAVFTPIPSASVTVATTLKTRERRKARAANLRSYIVVIMCSPGARTSASRATPSQNAATPVRPRTAASMRAARYALAMSCPKRSLNSAG